MAKPDNGGSAGALRSRLPAALLIRIVGALVAVAAVVLCGLALADGWSQASEAVAHANVALLLLALVVEAAAMTGLGVLWYFCLRVFASRVSVRDAVAWYFAGELGKYVPGGVWPVLGRGEMAGRSGRLTRADAYGTTLIGYAMMCIGAAYVCAALAPALATGGGLSWGWILVALVPVGLVVSHPGVLGRLLSLVARLTRGRVHYQAPSWSRMLGLSLVAAPTWVLVGAGSVLVSAAFGFHQDPARVAFAAIAAWIIGFLAVPVPAGAGVRELVFVAICGLGAAHGIVAAAGARALLITVDAVGGLLGLWLARRRPQSDARSGSGSPPVVVVGP